MENTLANAYAAQKLDSLKQCIRVTEDMIAGLEDPAKLLALIEQRNSLFAGLVALDEATAAEVKRACTLSDRKKIDQTADLLQKLNNQAVKNIKKERQNILAAMKVNVKEHKFIAYNTSPVSAAGTRLDKKR